MLSLCRSIARSFHSSPLSRELEEALQKDVCRRVNVYAKCHFHDYLTPNEGTPRNIQPHLKQMSPGLIVSVGTERSFYNLLFSDERCKGLVIRDINPRVKAYVDFLVLLLRISDTRKEFVRLSKKPSQRWWDKRIELIRDKLEGSAVPSAMKTYYSHHLSYFATVYFPRRHMPWDGDNSGIKYRSYDSLFDKLQRYAREGNIIATKGEIGDLSFLGDRRVSIVDTSNICFYHPINIEGNAPFNPRIIWTIQDCERTTYFSYQHEEEKLTREEKEEFDRLLGKAQKGKSLQDKMFFLQSNFTREPVTQDPLNNVAFASYSRTVLDRLRRYHNQN